MSTPTTASGYALCDGRLTCLQCGTGIAYPLWIELLYCPVCEAFHVPHDPDAAFEQGKKIGEYLSDRGMDDIRAGRPAPRP